MGVATTLAIVGAVTGLVGAGLQYQQGKKQQKAAKRERAARQQQEKIQNRRSRMSAIREAQIKRAAVVNFAGGMDAGGSSGVTQATGSIGSQLGTNIGFSEAISAGNRNISRFQQQQVDAQAAGSIFGSISSLGFGLAGQFGGGALQSLSPAKSTVPSTISYGNFSGTGGGAG